MQESANGWYKMPKGLSSIPNLWLASLSPIFSTKQEPMPSIFCPCRMLKGNFGAVRVVLKGSIALCLNSVKQAFGNKKRKEPESSSLFYFFKKSLVDYIPDRQVAVTGAKTRSITRQKESGHPVHGDVERCIFKFVIQAQIAL